MKDNLPTIAEFTIALQVSWGPDTCFDAKEWSSDNPARGHCVASSLVTQDYFGGNLKRYHVTFKSDGHEETHYCNILSDGTILDTTGMQYQWPVLLEPRDVDLKGYASIREKRLADEDTRKRYKLLADRVATKLQEITYSRQTGRQDGIKT